MQLTNHEPLSEISLTQQPCVGANVQKVNARLLSEPFQDDFVRTGSGGGRRWPCHRSPWRKL